MSTVYTSMIQAIDLLVAAGAPIRPSYEPNATHTGTAGMMKDSDANGNIQALYFQTAASAREAAALLGIPETVERVAESVEAGIFKDNRTEFFSYRLNIPQDAASWDKALENARRYFETHGNGKHVPDPLQALLATPVAELPDDKTIIVVGDGLTSRILPSLLREEGFHVESIKNLEELPGELESMAMANQQATYILVADSKVKDVDTLKQQVSQGKVPHLTRFTPVEALTDFSSFELQQEPLDSDTLYTRLRSSIIEASLREQGHTVPADIQKIVFDHPAPKAETGKYGGSSRGSQAI